MASSAFQVLPRTSSPCSSTTAKFNSSSIVRLCCQRKIDNQRTLPVLVRAYALKAPRSGGPFVSCRWRFGLAAASYNISDIDDPTSRGAEEKPLMKESGVEPAEKIIGVLKDTTEQLKEQAEKVRAGLAATAQETAEKGKENLSYIAENAPDPFKDIAETALKAHSPESPGKGSKIHDFCLGIPYGTSLVIGGFLWFIISGSTAAIRFGVILGSILLALSISSLKAWKKGESSMPYIKGQAAITFIIMIRELRRLSQVKAVFPTAFAVLISAAMVAFYVYVYFSGGNPPKKSQHSSAA